MEWNGMEWDGMEWDGMEWDGMGMNVYLHACIYSAHIKCSTDLYTVEPLDLL